MSLRLVHDDRQRRPAAIGDLLLGPVAFITRRPQEVIGCGLGCFLDHDAIRFLNLGLLLLLLLSCVLSALAGRYNSLGLQRCQGAQVRALFLGGPVFAGRGV